MVFCNGSTRTMPEGKMKVHVSWCPDNKSLQHLAQLPQRISLVSQIPSSLESPYSFRPLKNILLACNSCMGGIHCVFTDVLTTYLRAWSCHSISKAFLDKPPAKNCKSLSSTNTLDTFSSIFSTSVTTFCSYKYTHTHIYINTFHSLP
jgi:hypothetical protein